MPGMPRPSKKSSKIAFSIIGTPPNLVKVKKNDKTKKQRDKLNFEEIHGSQ